MNQAEVIHAGWVHRDCPNLSMLDVCQADTCHSLLLDIGLKDYQSGAAPGRKGPCYANSKKNEPCPSSQQSQASGPQNVPR